MSGVETLYKNFAILADAKDKILEHEAEYKEILLAVQGGPNEKRLASQFIARFFKHFPNLADRALNAHLDLCEDDDVAIRKQAIKDLPSFCKDQQGYVSKIADVLGQLLQSEEPTELDAVHSSLVALLHIHAPDAIRGMFTQILTDDEVVRGRALKFLSEKLKSLGPDIMNAEAEKVLLEKCKKLISDCTPEEFLIIMTILGNTRVAKTVKGQQEIVDVLAAQLEDEKSLEMTDVDTIDRIVQCTKHAVPFFNKFVPSNKFLEYFIKQMVPSIQDIPEEKNKYRLEILKLLAEMSPHANEVSVEDLEVVYSKMLEYMPLPPENFSGDPNEEEKNGPILDFSYIECLLYTFHKLGAKHSEFLENDSERTKDFRARLQYLARRLQLYITRLRESLRGKSGIELKTEENKVKLIALKTTANINSLIKDLFHIPPHYKVEVSLSWVPSKMQSPIVAGRKHKPVTFEENGSGGKKDRELYSVPSGKYSTKVGKFDDVPNPMLRQGGGVGGGGRGRGGGWGRGRGQGRGRGSWNRW